MEEPMGDSRHGFAFALLLLPVASLLLSCSDGVVAPDLTHEDIEPLFDVGDDPAVTLTGWGTATIDGVLDPEEWEGAGSVPFEADLPERMGGGSTPAMIYVMNDAENLYLAVRLALSGNFAISTFFEFDNNNDGARDHGDDVVGVTAQHINGSTNSIFADDFRYFQPPAHWYGPADTDLGGTSDGSGGFEYDGTYFYTEMSHPLDSADDAHDFSLGEGDIVGFMLATRIGDYQTDLNPPWPEGWSDTDFPANVGHVWNWGDIIIASKPDPETREECMDGGWEGFGFKNLGLCIRFVETGKDSRIDG
jgi:hypothetical protein